MATPPLPSSVAPPPSSPSLNNWSFPYGPSSRYHMRERSNSYQHARVSSYTPRGPNLSTEKRAAHRRAQSSGVNALLSHDTIHTGRSPLGRFHSDGHNSRNMASSPQQQGPVTPAKSPEMCHKMLSASPFSDYFSDAGRSVDNAYVAPTSETRQIVVVMQKLQAQLMRDECTDEALNIVWRKMGEIEDEMQALHSQMRMSPDIGDSGLFMDDPAEREEFKPQGLCMREESANGGPHISPAAQADKAKAKTDQPSLESKKAGNDVFFLEAQRVLFNLARAQEHFRMRYSEFRENTDTTTVLLEEKEQELEQLRSENERLKSDIGFDHSELLFLKLQFKALEVEVSALEGSKYVSEMKRSRILKEVKNWRTDWQAVEHKLKRRLSRYGVLSASDKELGSDSPLQQAEANEQDEDEGWHLQTVKKDHGRRVQSITIRRLPCDGVSPFHLEGDEEHLQETTYLSQPGEPAVVEDGPETAIPPLQCSNQGIQTSPPPSPLRHEEDLSDDLFPIFDDDDITTTGVNGNENEDPETEDDDCAITTSSSAPPSPVISSHLQEKTAWQDLWEGLSSFAGFGEMDDDD